MADNITQLAKEVVIGGAEHIRDSDIIETLVEGNMYIGYNVIKGTLESQGQAAAEAGGGFYGICIGQSIRQLDTDTHATILTAAKMMKVLKPMGGRVLVRVMVVNYTTGATIKKGSPVYYNGTGSTIGATTASEGNFFVDPACSEDGDVIGRLAKDIIIGDGTTDLINYEVDMWY